MRQSSEGSDEAMFRIAHTDDKTVNSPEESTNLLANPTGYPPTAVAV